MTNNNAQLLTQLNNDNSVYLYGTDGCHLCKIAHDWLIQTISVYHPKCPVHQIDIIHLPHQTLQDMANHIPIIVYQNQILRYPFGIMDIVKLLTQNQ